MSQPNLKKAFVTEKIGDFGGICRRASQAGDKKPLGVKNARDCLNFRILPSGALEKREGFKPIFTLPEEPRAFICGYVDGELLIFALIGDRVVAFDISSDSSEDNEGSLIGRVGTSEGKAEMFFFDGMLFVLDGEEFYFYDGYELAPVHGYVPLYGKNWDGSANVSVNEPLDLLSDMIRINYSVASNVTAFYVGLKCKSIVSVIKNGSYDATSEMVINEDGLGFHMEAGSAVGEREYEVILRLDESVVGRNKLSHCRRAVVYGGENDGRIILFGGDRASVVYASREVSFSSYNASISADPSAIGIYFPVTSMVSISYGRFPVTAVCRYYDRLLIFTEGETWMADLSGTKDRIIPVNSSVGCLSERGAVLGGNTPYSVSGDGIYKWSSSVDERDECSASRISDELGELVGEEFFKRAVAFYLRRRDEVWFADPEDEDEVVLVYSAASKKWFRFDGIPVDSFFEYKGNAAMLYGRYIFAFSEDEYVDTGIGGSLKGRISAVYESNSDDLGYPERKKHLKRTMIKADCDGEPLRLETVSDLGGRQTLSVGVDRVYADRDSGSLTHIDAHTSIGRFREMRFSLSSDGVSRPRIELIAFSASK